MAADGIDRHIVAQALGKAARERTQTLLTILRLPAEDRRALYGAAAEPVVSPADPGPRSLHARLGVRPQFPATAINWQTTAVLLELRRRYREEGLPAPDVSSSHGWRIPSVQTSAR